MKRYFWLVMLLALALIVVACGGSPTAAPTTAPGGETVDEPDDTPVDTPSDEPSGPFRVAVVMPSAVNDLAFSQSMFDALTSIRDEMGADNFEFVYSENMFVVDDAAAAIRDYASEGYDLVIAHGSQYGSALAEIAPDFPDTSFAHGTTVDTFVEEGINNVYAYEARSEQGGYVLGVIAASLSESNTLGVVGPIETGDAKLFVDGFVLGADGLSGTAQMVVGAIGVAEENGVPWYGTQSSQTSLAPSVVVANQVYDWTVVVKDIMDRMSSGELGGFAYAATLANGGLVMEYNEAYDLPAEVRALADETVAQIISGDIVVVEGAPPPPADSGDAEGLGGVDGDLVFGVVLVGPANDRGWSQAHAEGARYVEENIPGAQAIIFESLNPADKPEATLEGVVDDMVSQGAQLVLTTSDEFEEDTFGVAQKYPDVVFINVSGDDAWSEGEDFKAPANLGNLMGRMEDMKAVAGCAAALATETGRIGYLGPLINFETRRLTAAAYEGARYCYENYRGLDPDDLGFTVSWIGFWFNIPGVTQDPTEVTNNFIDTGHDVVISGIDTTEGIDVTGQRAAQGEAVWAVPYDYENACDNAPDICLGVPYFNWGPSYLQTAQQVIDGSWTQSWHWLAPNWSNLTDNDVTHVGWIHGPGLSADLQASLDEFIAGVASGDINVWSGPILLQDGSEYVAEGAAATEQQIWYLPQLLQGMVGPSQ